MHTFFLLLWGTYTLASIVGAITIVVLHGRRLRQDKKLRDEGIYITRVPRREALISLLTPIFPAGFFALYLYTQVELGILFNLLMFISMLFFPYHFLHVYLVYTKITPDDVEQKLSPFAAVTSYPIRAIDQVFYFQGDAEEELEWTGVGSDKATFYTKKGKEIASLTPLARTTGYWPSYGSGSSLTAGPICGTRRIWRGLIHGITSSGRSPYSESCAEGATKLPA